MTPFDKKAGSSAEQAVWKSGDGSDEPARQPPRGRHTTGLRQRGPVSPHAGTGESGTRPRDLAMAELRSPQALPPPRPSAPGKSPKPLRASYASLPRPPLLPRSSPPAPSSPGPVVASANEQWGRTVPIVDVDQVDEASRAVAEAARRAEPEAVAATTGSTDVNVELDWSDGDDIHDEDTHIGKVIDERYEVDAIIGEGGMGRVYLARHTKIGKQVAIKVLHVDLARDKEAVGRFIREARATSSIGNPHIVDISDFGELSDGSTYFVMEYLEGPTLAHLIEEQGALKAPKVCELALQLCEGLGAAHELQIVHRDLKPENITLIEREGRKHFCKILDFGIAKVSSTSSSTKLTMAGAVFGTPHYMSPEQAAGARVDQRTDIYSLGVMLYEMVAGQLPFQADNFMGILTQHMYKMPVPMQTLEPAISCPAGLEAIIFKCLTKKPDGRYASTADLAKDLLKFQTTGQSDAVDEMMARSGSFDVPADYFATGMHQAITADKGRRGRFWRVGALLLLGGAIAAGVNYDGVATPPMLKVIDFEVPQVALPSPPPTSMPTVNKGEELKQVLLYAEPANAVGLMDGKTITLPETVEVEPGQVVKVEVSAHGFVKQVIELDGSKAKVGVKLVRVRGPRRVPLPASTLAEPWEGRP